MIAILLRQLKELESIFIFRIERKALLTLLQKYYTGMIIHIVFIMVFIKKPKWVDTDSCY